MTISSLKGRMGTVLVAVVLAVVLLFGTALFGYFGYRLLVPQSPPKDRVALATSSPAPPTATPRPSRTPTPARTAVVIVAPTAMAGAPDATPTAAEQATAAKPTPTKGGSSGGSGTGGTTGGKLPQTGLGVSTPVVGLLLAGLASAARWLRQQRP